MKLDHWKQPTPVDQLTSLRGAIEGEISNIDDGVKPCPCITRCYAYLEEIALLEPFLRGDEKW